MRDLTDQEIETYRRDGVVCLRQVLAPEWVAVITAAVDQVQADYDALKERGTQREAVMDVVLDRSHLRALSVLGEAAEDAGGVVLREQDIRGGDGEFILVNNAVHDYEGVRQLALESPLPALAGQLFGSEKVNFIFDQVFIKEPGALSRTAFHQDQGYFKVDGEQVATLWTAAEAVDATNGRMGYVRGSHRWAMHAPNMFVSQATGPSHGLAQLPDIEGHESDYDIVYFDVEPGDVIVHDYRTAHGSRGNISADRARRAIAIRYGGDDVTYLDRPSARGEFPTDSEVADGDPLDSPTFPVVWRRS
jgi:hypothetical protein